jgi:hypothetical protein
MSAEKIEFVKPPATTKTEKRLFTSGLAVLLIGSLGLAGSPSQASIDGNQPLVITNGSTVSWTGGAVAYQGDQNTPANGHVLHICEVTVTSCTVQRGGGPLTAIKMPAAGSTSLTVLASDRRLTLSGQPVVELGEGTFKVQMVLWTNGQEAEVGSEETIVVSANQTTSAGGSVASPPPVEIDMQVSLPANALFAGNREFSLEAPNMSEVTEMTINGRPLPIVGRNKKSLKIRVPFLRPGSYNVVVSTETESWIIPNAITIGELPANIKSEGLDESFLKFSSELPSQTKQEIRSLIEETADLKSVTVYAIAKREIIGEDRNKLARSRAASAYEFIKRIDPEVSVKTEIIHYTEVELTSRGLFFKVAQKKQP